MHSGTKVQDGSGKMVVSAVGMRTEWGRLMETLSEEGNNETPLQVKLNGVATIIGKIGLVFAEFLELREREREREKEREREREVSGENGGEIVRE